MKNKESIFITGVAGFIGYHTALKLLNNGYNVTGIDNFSSYYDTNLKKDRVKILQSFTAFSFRKIDINNVNKNEFLKKKFFSSIIHLAAQPGVLLSKKEPSKYFDSNISGAFEIVKFIQKKSIKNIIYASSSSVYGDTNSKIFNENKTGNPISFYALTKKFNEDLFNFYFKDNVKVYGLRLFTVYGPYGRPDMAINKFINLIVNSKTITIRGNGKMKRDFSYIDDVVESVYLLFKKQLKIKSSFNKVINIGFNKTLSLKKVISILKSKLDYNIKIKFEDKIKEEVYITKANPEILFKEINKKIKPTEMDIGIQKVIDWYFNYYK